MSGPKFCKEWEGETSQPRSAFFKLPGFNIGNTIINPDAALAIGNLHGNRLVGTNIFEGDDICSQWLLTRFHDLQLYAYFIQ